MRTHRAIARRAQTINATNVADQAEYYLASLNLYKKELRTAKGLKSPDRIKKIIKKIDTLECEIIKLEDKIEALIELRSIEAAKLEEKLIENMGIIKEYLDPKEFKDFKG